MKFNFLVFIALSSVIMLTTCSKKERVEIRVIGEAQPPLEALAKLAKEYEQSHEVSIVVEQYEYETAVEKATLDLSSRVGTYDIILQPHHSMGRFSGSGFLFPVDSIRQIERAEFGSFDPNSALFPRFWKELSWYNNVCYGYPFTANTMFLCYRKDLLQNESEKRKFLDRYGYELKCPSTWKEYYDVSEHFTDRSKSFFGTCLQGKRHPALWYEWLNFAYSFGGGVMRTDHGWEYGPIVINSPATIEATEYYVSLLKFSPPGTLEFTWDDALAAMQQGNVFMFLVWSDAVSALENPDLSRVVGQVGYDMIPAGKTGRTGQIAGWSYLLSRFSKHKEEALKFISWMMQPDLQIRQQLQGGSSAVRDVYSDSRIRALPYTDAYVATAEVARSMSESVPEAMQISDIIQKNLSAILNGQVTVRQGLDNAAAELHGLLGDKAPLEFPIGQ